MARKQKSLFIFLSCLFFAAVIGFTLATLTMKQPERDHDMLPQPAPFLESPDVLLEHFSAEEPGGYAEPGVGYQGYLGVYNNRIAVFEGLPLTGTLQYITEYEVREDLREQLESGVPFSSTIELLQLLESFTS